MPEFSSPKTSVRTWLYRVAILLLFPALLINLGLPGFIDDEGIRSLVALEMKMSGNYLMPTIFGEYYYNKPPLYNWILLAFFELTGTINELTARLPTLIFLMLYAGSVFYYFKKHFSKKIAFLNAFALITCGRILFWDSVLGLIDMCFSWAIFLMFMTVFHAFRKRQFYKLFARAYFLTALAFLMKGLPAIVFLGTTLLTQFIFRKEVKKLFSLPHLIGGLTFIFIVGGYYFAYHQYNSLENVFTTLFNESSKRTFVEYGWTETILHFFTFPFEMTYHFLPWSLFVVYFFRKNILSVIRKNEFVTYNLLIFFTTIFIYWTSVEVYPRYLLMHVPLIFSAFFFLHFEEKKSNSSLSKIFEKLFFGLIVLLILASLSPLFFPETQEIEYLSLKVFGLFTLLATFTFLYQKLKTERLIILVLVLLTARIGFNWFVLPNRLNIDRSAVVRESSIEAGQKFKPLYSWKNSLGFQPANGFYMTRETGNILERHYEKFDSTAYYLIHPNFRFHCNFEEVGRVEMMYKDGFLYIGKLKK